MTTLHGSAVSRNGHGVLIIGAAGAGKSGLAWQLLAYGADLVADDAVQVRRLGEELFLHCPNNINGLIEARHLGLVTVKSIDQAGLAIVVDLDKTAKRRLPEPQTVTISGVAVPLICGKNTPNLGAIIWCLLGGGQLLPTV